jgi:hypothetical protein
MRTQYTQLTADERSIQRGRNEGLCRREMMSFQYPW